MFKLEDVVNYLNPIYNGYFMELSELRNIIKMLETRGECFLVKKGDRIYKNKLDIFGEKTPENIIFYSISCEFIEAMESKFKKYPIHPKIHSFWISSNDENFNVMSSILSIKDLKKTGFLHIQNKTLSIDAYIYFKNGEIINARFNEIESGPAFFHIKTFLKHKYASLRFYELDAVLLDFFVSSFELFGVSFDFEIINFKELIDNNMTILEGIMPQGYFQLYVKDKKIIKVIKDDLEISSIRGKIDMPFFLLKFYIFKRKEENLEVSFEEFKSNNLLKKKSYISNLKYFCPSCWNIFDEDFDVCPVCGYNIKDFTNLSYEQKLIIALSHPLANIRTTALKLLRAKNVQISIPFIKELILVEQNPFVLKEAFMTLKILTNKEDYRKFLENVRSRLELPKVLGSFIDF